MKLIRQSNKNSAIVDCRPALLVLLISLVLPMAARSQGESKLREIDLQAASFVSDASTGERVNRLSGNVTLRQDSTWVWADQAIQFTRAHEFLFSSRVMIAEATDTLRADTVRYSRQSKTGQARGNVRLSDGEVLVRSPVAFHDVDRKYTRFEEGVVLVDSASTLASRQGEYWSDDKRALFVGDVVLRETESVTRTDTVDYLREQGISDARGSVIITRTQINGTDANVTEMFGTSAHNESHENYSTVAGNALLVQFRTDSLGTDTTAIRASRLSFRNHGDEEVMTGAGSVAIWTERLAALADSVSFEKLKIGPDNREVVRLFRKPILWFEDTQVTGDSIRLVIRNGELDSLFVDGDALLAQEDTTAKRIQQVAGPSIRGGLSGDKREIRVKPGADAIYFVVEDGEPSGATQTHSDEVVMRFESDSLRQIVALGNIEGTYYAEEILPPTLQLAGFVWSPDRRPTRKIFAHDQRYVAAQAQGDN